MWDSTWYTILQHTYPTKTSSVQYTAVVTASNQDASADSELSVFITPTVSNHMGRGGGKRGDLVEYNGDAEELHHISNGPTSEKKSYEILSF